MSEADNKPSIEENDRTEETSELAEDKLINDPYYLQKEQDHSEIVQWIDSVEEQLQDLRLRKSLLEANFDELIVCYRRYISDEEEISMVAKTNMLEYFTYELLKPLINVGLKPLDSYNSWSTKRFLVSYQLEEDRTYTLNFKMNVVDERFDSDFMSLITINPVEMTVAVKEEQVVELIGLWYAEKIFSRSQISMINYDLNQLLLHFKELGFEVKESLLDNTRALAVELESDLPVTTKILDDIFITTMESEDYDFTKIAENKFDVLLNQDQHVLIQGKKASTHLFIDSNNRRRSILDFFTHYPFLVPLFIR